MTNDTLRAVVGSDPGAGLFAGLLMVNLTVGVSILAVAIMRSPVRWAFGPAAAYTLWIVAPVVGLLTVLAVFTPSDSDTGSIAAAAHLSHLNIIAPIWALGVVAMASVFARAQLRFLNDVRAGRAGPAVYGLIAPLVVLPTDDGRYTPEERDLIRTHEREHVARKDPRAAAAVALFQCLCWFNPLAHVAAFLLRLDQELACDAAVVMHRPGKRALYARTLLKTQLATQPLPFGCYWPARGRHPLEQRIAQLKRRSGGGPAESVGGGMVLPLTNAIRP